MQSRLRVISLLLFICCTGSTLFAQEAKKAGGMSAWDKNKDGLLQDEEIPEKTRKAVKKWAEKQGFDPNKPLPIKKLMKAKDGGKREKLESKGNNESDKEKRKKARKEQNEKAEPEKERKVAGFGKSGSIKVSVDKKSNDSDGNKEDDKQSAKEKRSARFYKTLARSMMYQNDKNKNGKLERSEWGKLKGNPRSADKNKDGVLSSEELENHIRGFGSKERDVTRRAPSRTARSKTNDKGKSFRFLTAHERLPEGLPGWFTAKDLNLDGQVSLREYLPEISADKLAKFQQFDLNNDGVIVAKEYLKATK